MELRFLPWSLQPDTGLDSAKVAKFLKLQKETGPFLSVTIFHCKYTQPVFSGHAHSKMDW